MQSVVLILDDEDREDPVVCQYKKICEDLGIVPISYFIRHINDTDIQMKYHGLDSSATKAISLILKDDVHIEKINLEGNWIKAEGARCVAKMLEENDYVTDLGLGDNKLGNDGARSICKILEINGSLRSLDLSGNEIDDNCADCISGTIENCKNLKHLNLSHNRFGEPGGEKLGPAIGANDRLDSLDLSWNHVRKVGACAIAKGLKENVGLKVCKLAWNGFGPEGGCAIADALATNQSLTELDISGNRLNLTSAEKISKAFKTNDTLKVLRMGNNLITTTGAICLATAINTNVNCELELLDLTDIPVEYEFLRIVEDIKAKRKEFQVIHGPIIRSGNTGHDLSKPAIDPYKRKEPVLILDGHIVVNDLRLIEILSRYDPTGCFSVSPEDFITALDELAVPYDKLKLQDTFEKISKDQSGRIYLGDALQKKDNEKTDETFPEDKS
ncbi:hypothetical protein LOTGIDRAFT_212481 [Lottia gigantea]|uniref:EF-hand domain-containing protein n=1 Tax=Lottia gigantea TaxID=225164 RepID=V4AZ05_LOTGI|nr:hypothetical protein LOTGIDRAFT_212481 [Lottia gigantea]ESP02953.1 hypothetical protein LOTGIDRAFT_212481 [Lottia gigantea]